MDIRLKRIYDAPAENDGYRVLVDRLWPRGISKDDAQLDDWLRDIAPSDDLRRWFDHEADKWERFQERYRQELEAQQEALQPLLERLQNDRRVTLLYGARNRDHNQAVVLKAYLKEQFA